MYTHLKCESCCYAVIVIVVVGHAFFPRDSKKTKKKNECCYVFREFVRFFLVSSYDDCLRRVKEEYGLIHALNFQRRT